MSGSEQSVDLQALRRTAKVVSVLAWGVAGTIMIYGIPIVYRFLVHHGVPGETAWLLSLAVDGALAVGLIATPILARYGIKGGWVGVLRWVAGFATWALNTAEAWLKPDGPDFGGVFSHTWGPLMMFFAVEAAAYFQRKIADVISRAESEGEAEDETARQADLRRAEEVRRLVAEAEEADRKRATAEAEKQAEQVARRKAEERAAEAEARAEEHAAESRKSAEALERKTDDAEQSVQRYRAALEEVKASARDARTQAAEASELAARNAGQLDEARSVAECATRGKLLAEQELAAVTDARKTVAAELERVSAALARMQQRAEGPARRGGRRDAGSSASVDRKNALALPASPPAGVPAVDGVTPRTVFAVLTAYQAEPSANRARLAELAGTSDRTVRMVLNNLPAGFDLASI